MVRRLRVSLTAGLFWLALSAGTAAAEQCRQALALGLDVSGSVDQREYKLQINGLVSAFDTSAVRRALFGTAGAYVDVMIYEWSGPQDQKVLVAWTTLRSPADLAVMSEALLQVTRRAASPGTALGEAMLMGLDHLASRTHCWHRSLDISGDGRSNLGPEPRDIKQQFADQGITLNALVIGADAPGIGDLRQAEISALSSYFRTQVIAGPDAFVQTALGYDAYADAMARKLERELKIWATSEAENSPSAAIGAASDLLLTQGAHASTRRPQSRRGTHLESLVLLLVDIADLVRPITFHPP